MSIKIYGASDDLIEVEGDIREEFNPSSDGADRGTYLGFSDGTVLKVLYDNDGMWRITPKITGTATYEKHEATDADSDYTDRVILTGDISWVLYGEQLAKK